MSLADEMMANPDSYGTPPDGTTAGAASPPPAGTDTSATAAPPPSIMGKSWWQGVGDKASADLSSLGRQIGLGTRDIITGLPKVGTAALDIATAPGRYLERAAGMSPQNTPAPSSYLSGAKLSDVLNLPTPSTPTEQAISTFNQGAASTLPLMALTGGASSIPSLITQGVQGGAGALGGQALASAPWMPPALKPTADLLGNALAALSVGGLAGTVGRAVNAATGNLSDLAQAYDRLDIQPASIGSVSEGETPKFLAATGARAPFTSAVVVPAAKREIAGFGKAVDDTASTLNPGVSATTPARDAGTIAQADGRDFEENVFPAMQSKLYAPIDKVMSGKDVSVEGYRAALQNAAADPDLAGLPNVQAQYARKEILDKLNALNTDIPPGTTTTWDKAQAIRKNDGAQMGTPDWQANIPGTQRKSMYAGIAGDLQDAATANGVGPDFAMANGVSTVGHSFIQDVLNKAIKANNPLQDMPPENAANNLLNNTAPSDMNAIRMFMPKTADALAAYKLRQMALSTGGKATDVAQTSPTTFSTQYINLANQKRDQFNALFGDNPDVAQNMQDLNTIGGQAKSVERNANMSGTGPYLDLATLSPAAAYGFAHFGPLGAVAYPALQVGAHLGLGAALTNRLSTAFAGARPSGLPTKLGLGTGILGAAASQQ